jgi:hypothetical protein
MRAKSQNCGTSRDSVAREQLCKHIILVATKEHTTMEQLLEAVFSVQFVPTL